MFTRSAFLVLCCAAPLSFGCDREPSKPLPDAGEFADPDDDDGPFRGDDDTPRGRDGEPSEPEPDGPTRPLPPPVPADPPVTTACGELVCRDVLVGDIIVPPCCAEGDSPTCGLDLAPVTEFMPLRNDCVALEQPGNLDESCPELFFNDPVELKTLPGCCMAAGTCGVVADLSLLADFGCVDPRTLLLGAPDEEPRSCTPEAPPPEPEPQPEPNPSDDAGPGQADDGEPPEGSDAGGGASNLSDASVAEPSPDVMDASADGDPADAGR